ncbi:ABC transporter substrate-binding protein [Ruegeria marina]|uniref:ABC transporter, substrate binding protein, PQQ-dependent alcohol dehydrogenase system n=1 Tax=Ruegeria marina TaxID=639004 RepID=A0A1G6ZN16_9RHOB|nr:ABC transporter substrate-binding protein [Ruegeria marina]SDE03892.1 ABC transporter, substrate binding protein, PQQ-dependent alcohol dehydrogenase system [Ruegeria marina]
MTARMTRRSLLGGMVVTPALLTAAFAQGGFDLRVGVVLPLGGPSRSEGTENLEEIAEIARQGAIMGEEEMGRNGALFGHQVTLLQANAPGAEAAERAARRMVALDGAQVLVGGFSEAEARALGKVAEDTGILFLNIAATSDALRAECGSQTFHIEASAAMYLDALAGWYVRAGHRRWVILHGTDPEGAARLARARASLSNRHWGAKIAATVPVEGREFAPALAAVASEKPDAVLLLTDWHTQLDFLARYEAEGLRVPVAAFPEAATQTRSFYSAAMAAASHAGAGHRAALWEPTLDAYGARELNARAAARWGRPLDSVGWAAFQAMKIAYDAAQFGGAAEGKAMAEWLAREGSVLDLHKGIGVSFRPWDHQLRQSLYLVDLNPEAGTSRDVDAVKNRAHLVGELPAIYMPGTDPVERLDQLGDITPRGKCE